MAPGAIDVELQTLDLVGRRTIRHFLGADQQGALVGTRRRDRQGRFALLIEQRIEFQHGQRIVRVAEQLEFALHAMRRADLGNQDKIGFLGHIANLRQKAGIRIPAFSCAQTPRGSPHKRRRAVALAKLQSCNLDIAQ